MECKGGIIQYLSTQGDFVLIETLWNVKSAQDVLWYANRLVLIETLWNVKLFVVFFVFCFPIVLIETLWNVKVKVLIAHITNDKY